MNLPRIIKSRQCDCQKCRRRGPFAFLEERPIFQLVIAVAILLIAHAYIKNH
ncbi:MAG: hypothetical protein JST12_14535 [Armatimonadetes bacterium]|nr:hypothetical protein [Armatimonadota bacterium]